MPNTEKMIQDIFNNPSDENIKCKFKKIFTDKIPNIELTEKIEINNDELKKMGFEDFNEVFHLGRKNIKEKLEIFIVKANKNITNKESKQKQYKLAKEILSLKNFEEADAGIFIFYDKECNLRISLILKAYQSKKNNLSHYKRYTHFVSKYKTNRTFIKNFEENDFSTLEDIKKVFNEKQLKEEFYKEIQNWFAWALKYAKFPSSIPEENLLMLLIRIIFIWFLKEMKLIPEKIFDEKKLQDIVKDFNTSDNYYNAILQNLFFATLNKPIGDRDFAPSEEEDNPEAKHLYRYENKINITKEEFIDLFKETPYINGGLFDCLDIDGFSRDEQKRAKLPDFLFFSEEREEDLSHFYKEGKKTKVKGLINILKEYQFTADENSPIDIEISLDPEILGHIFENLLTVINPDTGDTVRKITGSYYTPKDIVDFMVEESVLEYLKTKTSIAEDKLRQIVSCQEEVELNDQEREEIIRAIGQIKIIDPAVGSGAFPIGILHKLVYILSKIDKDNQIWKKLQIEKLEELKNINEIFDENSNYPDYARKLYLIKNSIHGVDIQPIAIQITKLRIFLSLIIEQKIDKSKENFGIRPLPYLETKFIVANTLIGLNKIEQRILLLKDIKQLKKELKYLYKRHFNVKTKEEKLRIIEKAKEIKEKLAERLREIGFLSEGIEKVIKFDVFNQTEKADWFDPEWMFGVENGFDIVIGNPPYVRHKKIKNTKEILKKQEYKTFTSTANLYVYFYEKGIKLLKDKGILSYITSNNWLKADYGIKLRKYLKENTKIIKIINFSNYKIFEQEIYTNIITLQKNKPSQNWEFEFVEVKDNNIDNVIDFVKNNYHKVKQENLYIISWNFES